MDGFIVNAECWYEKLNVEVRDLVVLEMLQRPLIDHHAADIEWKRLKTDRRRKTEV
jgi:hypothetical protein